MASGSDENKVSDVERLDKLLNEVDEILESFQSKGLYLTMGLLGHTDKISSLLKFPFSTYLGVRDGAAQHGLEVPWEDIDEYLSDQSGYWSKRYGISKSHFEKWLEVRRNGQSCWALTKKNQPCRSGMLPEAPDDPSEYDPNKPVYCPIHENYAMDVVNDSARKSGLE